MKGYRKERKVVNQARAKGNLAFRSAGSHSPVDVVIVNHKQGVIRLIQCKAGDFSKTERDKLLKQWHGLNGQYTVRFYVE